MYYYVNAKTTLPRKYKEQELKNLLSIEDFIKEDVDCPVFIGNNKIWFEGPLKLTTAGKFHFRPILKMLIHPRKDSAEVVTDQRQFSKFSDIAQFFYAAAGSCSDEEYDRWFLN